MSHSFRLSLPVLLCLLLVWPDAGSGQQPIASPEAGLPFFTEHFSPHTIPQNWAVTQDSSGIIYVGNNDGVLVYDGVSWRLIRTRNQTLTRSLASGPKDRIYVGLVGDLGVLAPDSIGRLEFSSLRSEIPPDQRSFDDVWATTATSDEVYFQTSHQIFRWNGSSMKSWHSADSLHTSFVVDDTFYVRIRNRGLHRMIDDSLHLIPGGERFGNLHVFMMSPHQNGILIGTRQKGLFLKNGSGIKPIESDITSLLRRRRAYHGCKLADGSFAIATLGGGVVVIDGQGNVVDMLTAEYELPDNVVNFVYPDQQGGLWLALHNRGIARVDIPTPLTVYRDELSPDGIVYSMRRHGDVLYTATGRGLYYLDEQEIIREGVRRQSRFRQIEGIPSSWSLLSHEDMLLVASQEGIYALEDEEDDPRLISKRRVYVLRTDKTDSQRVLAGTRTGLFTLQQSSGSWSEKPIVDSLDEEVRSLYQSSNNTLWLATSYASNSDSGSVLRITSNPNRDGRSHVERFGEYAGLPPGNIRIISVNETPVFAASGGLYRFNSSTEKFSPHSPFPTDTPIDSLQSFSQDENGNLWIVYNDHVEVASRKSDGSYATRSPTPLRLSYSPFTQLYTEPSGVAWLSSGNGLIRYDPRVSTSREHRSRALIREIQTATTGRTIFGGASLGETVRNEIPRVPFDNNGLTFKVAAPYYDRPSATQFQYFLSGRSEKWSDWRSQPMQSFTGLSEGQYQFRVRAKNFQGVVSRTTSFDFRILPPWYRTWWAYGTYAVLAGVVGFVTVRYRKLVREQQRAKEQAKELAQERVINERLQEANRRLQEANQWKDMLVTNISHELRTPLAGIIGFTKVLKEEVSGHHHEFVDLIESNGRRLRQTIDRLLDMSKLEAGEMPLHLSEFDLTECIQEVADSLYPLAAEKNIDLHVDVPSEKVKVDLDEQKTRQVLNNLIGNAIKFTEEGHVRTSLQENDDGVQIVVEDTGIGITDDFKSEMFDAFTQESKGMTRTHEGAGLGLFITDRLVRLMGGHIDVTSTKGKGTEFRVTFPPEITRRQEDEFDS